MQYNLEKAESYGMSANALKIVAICAMLIDHIAWAFVPTATLSGQLMHIIGRITAPIMTFFIAEGYYHTRNLKKYAMRLGIFALISHIPFVYFESGKLPIYFSNGIHIQLQTSVIYTLFLGLLSLIVWNSQKLKDNMKTILIVLICIASLPGDWNCIGVLWVLVFGINHGNIKKQMTDFSIISACIVIGCIFSGAWRTQMFQLGVYLAIPLLYRYNGKLGYNPDNKWIKWSFYIFYPLHLLIIGLIKFVIL